jgi:hypothetical protein
MAYEIMIDAPPGSINHNSWKLRAFITIIGLGVSCPLERKDLEDS